VVDTVAAAVRVLDSQRALPAHLIAVDGTLWDEAARLDPVELGSLAAIPLASAPRLGDELESFVVYADRRGSAGRGIGLPVVAPTG
jgi:hypothetical protein